MNHNDNNHDDVVEMSASGHAFHEHQQHCDTCRSDVMSSECQEGNRALRQTVRDGSAFESDRVLDSMRNGPLDED